MDPQAYVTGQPVALLSGFGGLKIAAEWPDSGVGGPVSASFDVLLGASDRPGWLVKGALAEVRLGGSNLLAGQVTEVDWSNGGSISIDGAAREGTTTACLTAGNLTSSTPDTVIDAAISRGALTWTRPASISTTALVTGDQTANINNVTDLLAAYATESGQRLYVGPYRRILAGSDPTVPTFVLQPGSGELAWASEAQATRVVGSWVTSGGVPQVSAVGSGAVERIVSLAKKGPLDSTRAINILNGLLASATAGGWTGGITVSADQIVGRPHLGSVLDTVGRGCMFRLLGQRDPRPGRVSTGYVDFIAQRAEWDVPGGTITLTPRGMVARDWSAIVAAAGVESA